MKPLKIKVLLIRIAGFTALFLGSLGVFVPLLPTTPFVILASFCFSYTNPKVAAWLRKNRFLGPYLENWYAGCGVTLSYKIKVVLFVWVGLGSSIYFVDPLWLKILLAVIGLCVSIHIFVLRGPKRAAQKLQQEENHV